MLLKRRIDIIKVLSLIINLILIFGISAALIKLNCSNKNFDGMFDNERIANYISEKEEITVYAFEFELENYKADGKELIKEGKFIIYDKENEKHEYKVTLSYYNEELEEIKYSVVKKN